uniref:ABC-2 type transporter transmembrane domain-containing protein n=1 Tax=Megaselia scalaris TaxID=36166 RepID=T1GH68_MEGSC
MVNLLARKGSSATGPLAIIEGDLLTVQLRVVIHLVVGFLLGVVFYDMGNDAGKVLSNASFLFFCVLFIFFGNALPALLTCPLETSVFIREHLNGWYSITSYYFAKLVSDLPLLFICPTLLSVIAYYMTGQLEEIGRFAMFWGMALLTGLLGQSIGLVYGSAFKLQ